jgi:hypothetical protein
VQNSRPSSGRKLNPRRKLRVGRPAIPISFWIDEDRHAVALVEMMCSTKIGGKLPSVRVASWRAAFLTEGRLLSAYTSSNPPPDQLAPSGRRNSPINPALKNGYRELQLGHVDKRQGGDALDNAAQRLRRKHRDWSKDGRVEKIWLQLMAIAWAAALYPHAARRDYQYDPAVVCRLAAAAAHEESFCEAELIPKLDDQQASALNRQFCQRVKAPIF